MKKTALLCCLSAIAGMLAGSYLFPTKVETTSQKPGFVEFDAVPEMAMLLKEWSRFGYTPGVKSDSITLGRDFYQELTTLMNNSYLLSTDKEQTIRDWYAIPEFRDCICLGFDGDCGGEFLIGLSREDYEEFEGLYRKVYEDWESVMSPNL